MANPAKRSIGLLVLSGVVALLFVVTGVSKLAAVPPSPENFARWGLSLNFMRAIGAIEVLGGVALMIPRLAKYSAVILIAVMFGAIKTGVVYHELMHVFLPLALVVLLGVIFYARRAA